MNATATHSALLAERAEAFAAAVRSNLADLPAEELDDLLDGLGADLTERLSDGGELGDAAQYADELRQAAGIPPRDPASEIAVKQRVSKRMGEWISTKRANVATWFGATPARVGFRDFALTLRPLWWVLRAMVVVWAGLAALGHPFINGLQISFVSLVFNAAAIVVSVQWGRGKWLPKRWLKVLYTVASVTAVILLVPVLMVSWSMLTTPITNYIDNSPAYSPGLFTNGEQVTNIFAYDCEGNLLDSVRLYDQDGNPLDTTIIDEWADGAAMAPEFWDEKTQETWRMDFNPLAADAEAWNVFPLTVSALDGNNENYGKAKATTPKKDELPPLSRDCKVSEASGSTVENESDSKTDAATKETEEAGAAQ